MEALLLHAIRFHMKTLLIALFIFVSNFSTSAFAQVNFEGLPPSQSAQEALANRDARRDRIIDYYAAQPLMRPPIPPKENFGAFAMTMIARMHKKQDLANVSQNLLTPTFKAWLTGTDMALLGKICYRMGDFDFVMMSLLKMAYLDEEAGKTLLTEEARYKLRHELLYEVGNDHHIKFKFKNCLPIAIRDSENHILMTETARYLTNQLLLDESRAAGKENPIYDNEKNGFNTWFMNHLSQFMRKDFDELNSRPYQGYTLVALGNLYSYARDPRLKMTVQMILDYLSAKTSIQTNGLRRYMPFRRQKVWRDTDDLLAYDNTIRWYVFHTGAYKYLELMPGNETRLEMPGEAYMPFMAANDTYEVPTMILDLFTNRPKPIFDRIKTREVEIYYSSPNFLLSSGGRHRSVFGFFTGQNDSWGVSTTIIPKNYGLKKSELFSIDGSTNWNKVNNLCVAPNFACGENLKVPANIPASCVVQTGDWSFYDLANCPVKMDIYVATYTLPAKPGQKSVSLLEVREPNISFEQFRNEILKNNRGAQFSLKKQNTFVTSEGKSIDFTWSPANKDTYPISSYDGKTIQTNTKLWPLGNGSTIKSAGDGLITIENGITRERLVLDGRDILKPQRRIEKF